MLWIIASFYDVAAPVVRFDQVRLGFSPHLLNVTNGFGMHIVEKVRLCSHARGRDLTVPRHETDAPTIKRDAGAFQCDLPGIQGEQQAFVYKCGRGGDSLFYFC